MSCSIKQSATETRVAIARKLLFSSSALVAVLAAASAAGAQTVTELEGIVIQSANRTPTEAAKVGSSVEVVTEKDLEKQSKTFLKDYLQQLPGVSFRQSGAPGSTAGISVRGATSAYVKVLVDGIDVSDPSGITAETHFEHLLVGDVSRIEVLKGSQSGLYGGDAVGGVISIETKAATRPGFSHSGGAEGGRYNTFRGAYTAGYAADDGSNVSFTVQGIDTDGFSTVRIGTEDDGYRNVTVSGRGTYRISDTLSVFFAARTTDAKYDFDSSFPLGDADNTGTFLQHAGRVGADITLLDGAFRSTIAFQGMKLERESIEPLGWTPYSWFEGDRIKAEYQGVLEFNERLALLFGADWEETGTDNANINGRVSSDIAGAFAQLMVEPLDGLVLTGGGRIDDHSNFGKFNTYRFTAAYVVPGTETKFRGSIATGFRAPSLDELFGDYGFGVYGNPHLEPEESESWDVGIEQGFLNGRFRLSATYFELDTDNMIAYAGACTIVEPCMINIPGLTHRKGVELSAAAMVTDGLVITAAYTLVDSERPDGTRLPRIPRHSYVLSADLQPIDKVEINVTAQFVRDVEENAFTDLDDYTLLSAKASYEFAPGWKAYVRGENLLDEDYQTVLNHASPGLSVYGGITMALPSD